MNWRNIKAVARGVVHSTFRVRAFYWGPDASAAVPCHVRVHTSYKALGDMAGTSYDYAEIEAITPRIIFWLAEVMPDAGGVVAVGPTEAYAIGTLLHEDVQTQTVEVTKVSDAEADEIWRSIQ